MKTPFATIIPPKHNYIKSVRSQNPLQQDLYKNTHKSPPDTHTQNPTTQADPKHSTTPPAKTAKPEYIAMQQESQKEQRVLKVSMFSALVLATLSLLLCITPVRICVENFKDLLMVAPKEIDEKLTAIMENLSMRYGFSDYDTHTAKSGRFYMIEVNILLDGTLDSARTTRIGSINDVDKIRDEIEQALQIPSYKIWLSVSFTANPKWL